MAFTSVVPVLLYVLLLCVCHSQQYDGYTVQQVHLAQGKTSASMTVMWATVGNAASDVLYSLSPEGKDALHVSGKVTSYSFDYPGKSPYTSPYLHSAVMTGLAPGTTYYYSCGDLAQNQWSGWLSYKTLPAPGDSVTFAIIGDLGLTNDSLATLSHIAMNPSLSMILHAGDLPYADCNAPLWDQYGVLTEPLASTRPWMSGPGNHEIEYIVGDDGSGLYKAYEHRFIMPSDKPAELGKITHLDPSYLGCCPSSFQSEYNFGNSFYSFDAGLAHIIYANAYSTTDENSAQFQWLSADLKGVDRSVTPWIFVVVHCPWYNSNTAHHDEYQTVEMRANMETLFYDHGVNAVFAGHVHAYERTFPVFKNLTDSRGITYINIGDAGNAEGHSSTYYTPSPQWSAYRNGTQYGHGELHVEDANKATWRWLRNVDGEYVSRDEIVLCNAFKTGSATC